MLLPNLNLLININWYNTMVDIFAVSPRLATVHPGYGKQGLRPVTYSSNQKIEVSDE